MAVFCLSESLHGTEGAAGADHRGLHPRPEADHRRRPEGPRGDDRAAEGRHQAEPGADAGEQPGLHPRRPVRQHRPRLQQRAGHQAGHAALRVHRDRGRLRRRPGRGEVHEHQVPQGGHQAQRGGDRGHGPGAEAPRRRADEGTAASPTSRPSTRAWRTSRSTSRTSTASACRWSWPSTTSPATRPRRSSSSRTSAPTCR